MENEKGYRLVGDAPIENFNGVTIPMGASVPWPETVEGINKTLMQAKSDQEGFGLLMRIAALMYKTRAHPSQQDLPSFLGVCVLYYDVDVHETVVQAEG
jgi:hypothetical protein